MTLKIIIIKKNIIKIEVIDILEYKLKFNKFKLNYIKVFEM